MQLVTISVHPYPPGTKSFGEKTNAVMGQIAMSPIVLHSERWRSNVRSPVEPRVHSGEECVLYPTCSSHTPPKVGAIMALLDVFNIQHATNNIVPHSLCLLFFRIDRVASCCSSLQYVDPLIQLHLRC